jgi:limonene-1,2-epoxide hydrolase
MFGRREIIISSAALLASACSTTPNTLLNNSTKTRGDAQMDRRFKQFQQVIEAWKRKDVDAVVGMMTDDVVWHYAAAIAPPARGKDAARAFLDRFGKSIAEINWRIFHSAETEDRLFVEGVDEYISTEGVSVAAPYAGIIEFRGDKISGWRDYVDYGVITAMKEGGAYSDQVKELIDRPSK